MRIRTPTFSPSTTGAPHQGGLATWASTGGRPQTVTTGVGAATALSCCTSDTRFHRTSGTDQRHAEHRSGEQYAEGVFGRQKNSPKSPPTDPEPQAAPAPAKDGRKGRPTPKRRDVEAANRRPLVPDDRKAARRNQREQFARARREQQEAMLSGDEEKMPLQHRGPARRFMRDYVDARWSPGELFLPVAILIIVVLLAGNLFPQFIEIIISGILVAYLYVLLAIVDAVILAVRVRKKAREKFGAAALGRGALMYIVFRCLDRKSTRLNSSHVAIS